MFQKGLRVLSIIIVITLVYTCIWNNDFFVRIHEPSGLIGSIHRVFRGVIDLSWCSMGSNQVSYSPVVLSELGQALNLLQIGDSWGAEVICQTLSDNILSDARASDYQEDQSQQQENVRRRRIPTLIDTLICLGEARLTLHRQLHDSLWNRFNSKHPDLEILESLLNKQLQNSLGKLHAAKENFETVVSMDPMNPRARSDLGLTLMLLATRSSGPFQSDGIGEDDNGIENADLDMLFDATLHLNAAVTLTERRKEGMIKDLTPTPIFHAMDETMYVSTLYNSALAHLALGDYITTIKLLKRVHDLLRYEDPRGSYKMLSIPLINVVGVLIQMGQINEALTLLLEMDIVGYCSSQEIASIDKDRVLSIKRRPVDKRLMKICLIIMNNRDLAVEMKAYDEHIDLGMINNSSLLGLNLYEISSELNQVFIKSDDVHDALEFSKVNRGHYMKSRRNRLTEIDEPSNSVRPIHEEISPSKTSVKHALNSLQNAAHADPDNARIWLSLTRAKLVAGDFIGAVEAATQAVNVAIGLEEIEAASRSLELALERLSNSNAEDKPADSLSFGGFDETEEKSPQNDNEVQSLRLERDILNLKLQLLQQDSVTKTQAPSIQVTSLSQHSDEDYRENAPSSFYSAPIDDHLYDGDIFKQDIMVEDTDVHNHADITNNSFAELEAAQTVTKEVDETVFKAVDIHVPSTTASITQNETDPTFTDHINNTVSSSIKIQKELNLPVLFRPEIISAPTDISPTALSYMKIADAHMSKNQFQQAAKHFSKVLKRHQDHLPALLGYASAYERSSNSNQLEDVCIAYMQAAQVALIRGAYDLTDAVMQRALDVSLLIPNQKRLGILEKLFNYSHTDSIAADVSYEIGRVLSAQNYSLNDARYSFQLANALMEREAGNSSACHARSNLELGRISLENESDYASAIIFVEKALLAGLDEVRVQALVILGRSKALAGDFVAAEAAFFEAIDLPTTEYSAQAHYHLGVLLKNNGGNNDLVEKHFVHALNLGMDASEDVVNVLGEYHIAVLKSVNRAKRREYEQLPQAHSRTSGVLSGASISDKSIFQRAQEEPKSKSDTLSLLEQGAASYDGQSLPDGEEIGEISTSLRNTRRSESVVH